MCELLGMSANVPTDIVFSFTGLMQRGGQTGPHRDGWGIGFYEDRGLRVFHDPQASADSEIARLVQSYPIKSTNVIGHIREANVGAVNLANTHPFVRELWGRHWCFAHNGQLDNFHPLLDRFRPVGSTDSETAFCDLLNHLHNSFDAQPDTDQLLALLVERCDTYRKLGVFNCLLSNGEWLFTYCSTKLAHITRRAPFGPATLRDADMTVDFQGETTANDIVTVITTEPLTDNEKWHTCTKGEWRLWKDGLTIAQGSGS